MGKTGGMTHRAQQGFKNREQAGASLGLALATDLPAGQYVVLGLLRGGVPIAAEVAKTLGGQLGALAVRKLGIPSNPELAFGAVASYRGQTGRVLNEALHRKATDAFGTGPLEDLEIDTVEELDELAQNFNDFAPQLEGRIVVLCDDGLATGATMKAGLKLVRRFAPELLIAAVPVAPPEELDDLARHSDRAFTLLRPKDFSAVGAYYEDFMPVAEDVVLQLLRARA